MKCIDWVLVLVILLVAAGLRITQLDTYPPGPHYDEAANLVITRNIMGGATYFPIVTDFQGREVLYYYLSTPFVRFIADDIFAMQLVSVFSNLITIAGTIALGKWMFPGRRGHIIGLVAGALLTLSFPQLFLSRQAFRAVTLPLMQTLTLVFLWRGLRMRQRSWRWLVLAGIFAGATLYTYNSSRLFPLWLGIVGLFFIMFDQGRRWWRFKQGGVFFGVLLVVATPMLLFAIRNPDVFLGRLVEVTDTDTAVTLGESLLLHLRMFFLEGDPYFRYNITNRPYFTLPEGIFLIIGFAVALWRVLRGKAALERTAYILLLLSPFMILPSVIAVGGLPPNHMRSVAMVPLIFLMIALGVEVAWGWLAQRLARLQMTPTRIRYGLAGGLVVLLFIGGGGVWRLYADWANKPALYAESNADLAVAGEWLAQQELEIDTRVFISTRNPFHPTILIEDVPPITWLGPQHLFLPPPHQNGLYIFSRNVPLPSAWERWLNPVPATDIPLAPDGMPAFQVYASVPDESVQPVPAIQTRWLQFVGVDTPTIPAGEGREIVLQWQVKQEIPFGELYPVLVLSDQYGNELDRKSVSLWQSYLWNPGEHLIHQMEIAVPDGTPPGSYQLDVLWVDRYTDQITPFVDEEGVQAAVQQTVGMVEVVHANRFPEPSALSIESRQDIVIAEGVHLLGWHVPPMAVRPGSSEGQVLYWQASPIETPRQPLSFELALVHEGEKTMIWEGVPGYNQYGVEQWVNGEILVDRLQYAIPLEQPPGEYQLQLIANDMEIGLGQVEVVDVQRVMEPIPVDVRSDVLFGGVLRLQGYSLEQDGDLQLQLVWQAQTPMRESYTIFVHVLDEGGNILMQRDVMPNENQYPTHLWIPGEYVADNHLFPQIPPNAHTLRFGVYLQSTGERLSVVASDGEPLSDFLTIVLE